MQKADKSASYFEKILSGKFKDVDEDTANKDILFVNLYNSISFGRKI